MDQVRGVAIVLVIAYHAKTVLWRFLPDVPDSLSIVQELFEPFRMPLLVALSGMLLSRSLAKPPAVFVSGKLRRIAWPYLVWSALWFAVTDRLSLERLLMLAVDPPNYLWYLQYLLLYYLLALAAQAVRLPLLALAPAALVGSALVDGYGHRRFLFLLAFFLAGHLVTEHRDRLAPGHRRWWSGLFAAVAVGGALANALGGGPRYDAALAVVPAAGIGLCLLLAPAGTDGRVARRLGEVGRSSLTYYVTHYPVLWVVATGLTGAGVQTPLVLYAAGLGAALAAGAVLVRLRSRWLLVDLLFELPPGVTTGLPPVGRAASPSTATTSGRG